MAGNTGYVYDRKRRLHFTVPSTVAARRFGVCLHLLILEGTWMMSLGCAA